LLAVVIIGGLIYQNYQDILPEYQCYRYRIVLTFWVTR